MLIPDGTYMVNAVARGSSGILVGSNLTLRLGSGAILKAIPNASANYEILSVRNANRVTIVGGTLLGDRSAHQGSSGEWGMGLAINGSDQVVVDGLTIQDCWGDGFYVGLKSTRVTLCNVTADHNRRQGISITSVDGMVVRQSTFKNTTGTPPEKGINVEPNDGETANNVTITGCTLTNNAGGAFQCGTPFVGSAFGTNLIFDQNLVSGNGLNPADGGYKMAINITDFDGVQVTNNQVLNNTGEAIRLTDHATHTLVKGNTVKGTLRVPGSEYWTGIGILISDCGGSTITGNTVTGNVGPGIWQIVADSTVTISDNTQSGNGSN
ncbi:right-handed parallel beta-helix repeat-containing protein [Geothrix sp. PMB-07]|uniref:right-handed parallel beta-helix repeat-containing protein n=1 Tax=Geothrix sp. PMB-07 TaxID=3068640 RepID=UPI0027404826|nr:right-handed parallel beta-helix repeat-containing protein [Geothrix sp. PMB-07]WLT31179.1 right-handed parallel beta-helix repeat-containing protein [Geothrix sp. PMB-07]